MSAPILPPGLSEARWRSAIAALEAALGARHVFVENLDRQTYQDQFAVDPGAHRPLGGVAPETAEEVQAVVRIAAEYGVPIWPISRGKNLGYGGSAPHLTGSLVLDMSRMKKIEVDEENGTVLVEPGVGFYDLYDHLRANGIDLWLSVPANSWGSVAGNALDRGMGSTPYGEHATKICGMEVVLADGGLVRTGMGAMQDSSTWQLYRYGFGPSWDHMFTQSNLGVVTKVGLWLMPEPETMLGLQLEFDSAEDLGPLVDVLGPLRREGLLQQVVSVGSWLHAAVIQTQRSDWTDEPGALPEEVVTAIRRRYDIGYWGTSLRVYGREQMTKAAMSVIEPALEAIGPMLMKRTRWERGEPVPDSPSAGIPTTMLMQNVNWVGGRGGHIGFSPVLPQSGARALRQFKHTRDRCREYGFDYLGSFNFGERHLVNSTLLHYDLDDHETLAKIGPFIRSLIGDAKAEGYSEYRTHLDFMDDVAATYDFNDHALLRLNQRVKKALDPKGIIAPGKSGIRSG